MHMQMNTLHGLLAASWPVGVQSTAACMQDLEMSVCKWKHCCLSCWQAHDPFV
jgi:hypothetical protein